MPVTINELVVGRSYDSTKAQRQYLIRGVDTDYGAHAAFLAAVGSTVPATLSGWPFIVREAAVVEKGPSLWEATATYHNPEYIEQKKDKPQVGDISISFDVSLENEHITQSLGTVASVAYFGDARDFKKAINVSKDGGVEGVDKLTPRFTFQISLTLNKDDITDAYITTLKQTVGKVNNASFKGQAAGEVLLMGVSGSERSTDKAEISFKFAVSENKTGITISPLPAINKKGWEYLWVYYEDVVNETDHTIEKVPAFAYVEKIYEEANFDALGIPSTE